MNSGDPRAGCGGCATNGSAIKTATMVRMVRLGFLIQFICAIGMLAHADALDERIRATVEGFQGNVFLFAKNLDSGATYGLRPDEPVRTASTIKLPILAATFQAVAEGKIKWTDFTTLRKEDKVSGSGILGEFADDSRFTLADVAHLMIVLSDNTATNLILDKITADYVNDYLDTLRLTRTRSMRKVRGDGADLKSPTGFSRAGRIPENERFGLGSSTPREMVMLLEKIERREIVSKEASDEILKVLRRQQDRNGIARRMGTTPVANKAGALDRLRSDVGIVYSKGGRVAIAITCDDMPASDWSSDNPGLLMIARLSEILVAGLAK
jgi:beta-lactamase class A